MSTTMARKLCRCSTTRSTTGVEEELRAVLGDLGEDQLAEVLAFCWIGEAPRSSRLGRGDGGSAAAANGSGTIDE